MLINPFLLPVVLSPLNFRLRYSSANQYLDVQQYHRFCMSKMELMGFLLKIFTISVRATLFFQMFRPKNIMVLSLNSPSFSHLPHVISQQILLALLSKYIKNKMNFYHFCHTDLS